MEDLFSPFVLPVIRIAIAGIVFFALVEGAKKSARSAIRELVYWLRDLFR